MPRPPSFEFNTRAIVAIATLAVALVAPLTAAAQDGSCTADDDCAAGERCFKSEPLVQCLAPPCEEPTEAETGRCVPEQLNEPCTTTEDCADERLECPDDPDREKFCVEVGDPEAMELAATSGLAPGDSASLPPSEEAPISAQSGVAGGAAPTEDEGSDGSSSGSSSDSGCRASGAGASGGSLPVLAAVGMLLLGRRRNRRVA